MNYKFFKIALIVLALINFLLPIGLFPLFDYDEGAFSEATREMLDSGDYITTYLNGNLRFDKPILIYWLQALSAKIFGLNEFAMRFPSAIAALLWTFGLYLFSKKYFNEKVALLATLFMISSLQINMIAKAAIADALLNLNIALAMFFIFSYLQEKKEKYLLLAFIFIGIGTLTKGPVAIMIPLVVTFLFMVIQRRVKEFFAMIFNLKGVALFVLIVAPWYIAEYIAEGQKFIDGFFLKHNLSRFSSSLEGHSGKYYYFIIVILIGLLPFTGYFTAIFSKIKAIFKDEQLLFLSLWFAFVFIFFSFSNTKLPHYIIYGYSPLFILMAYFFKKYSTLNTIFVLFFLTFIIFLPNIALAVQDRIHDSYVREIIGYAKETFNSSYQLFGVLTLIIIALSLALKDTLTKLFILGASFSIFFNFAFTNAYAKLTQVPIKEAALIAKAKNLNVIMRNNIPPFLFYSQKISKKAPIKKGEYVFGRGKSINSYKEYEILYKKYGIYLIKIK